MNPPVLSRPHFFGVLAGLALASGLVCSALVCANTWSKIAESQVINVTGSARKNIRSDLVVWRASFSVEAPTLLEAQQRLQADLAKLTAFLRRHEQGDFSLSPAQITEITARKHNEDDETTAGRRIGYRLTQALEVRSPEVERVPQLAGATGELLEEGVALVSGGFEFIYTKAGDTKVEMMAEATKDARARAEQIAVQGGRSLKELRSARMGVVQINPLYSGATSWDGNNDTSSLEKTITATITATFALR